MLLFLPLLLDLFLDILIQWLLACLIAVLVYFIHSLIHSCSLVFFRSWFIDLFLSYFLACRVLFFLCFIDFIHSLCISSSLIDLCPLYFSLRSCLIVFLVYCVITWFISFWFIESSPLYFSLLPIIAFMLSGSCLALFPYLMIGLHYFSMHFLIYVFISFFLDCFISWLR